MEEYSIVISNCVGRKKCLLYTGAVYCYREKNETHLGGAAVSRLAKLVNAVKESNLDTLLLTGEENIHYATHFPALEGWC